ncbi:hypothetical protein CPB85DRAFT_1566505 [Mucidula mucida]|nr:hypothetical protein CPB85DRAFT_1566505 [Mucidula mucida]
MSTCPALSEFKVLSSRIREIEIALDQVFDELDEAAIAPTASILKDLLARRRDLADQLSDTNIQLITLSKQQIHKDRAEITKNLAETRKINAEIRQDLEDFYRNVLGSSANYANPIPIITVPIDAVDDIVPSVQNEDSITSPTSGGAVETGFTVTSPRSKRKGMCLQDMMTPDAVGNDHRLPLAAIPNNNALSPTTKRKLDTDAAKTCLSGGSQASPAKRLKVPSHTPKQSGRQASTRHIPQVQRPLVRVGKDGRPLVAANVFVCSLVSTYQDLITSFRRIAGRRMRRLL